MSVKKGLSCLKDVGLEIDYGRCDLSTIDAGREVQNECGRMGFPEMNPVVFLERSAQSFSSRD